MKKRPIYVAAFAFVCAVVLMISTQYFGIKDVADESLRYELQAIGSSIYEFHTLTGRWPAKTDDLAGTSLPLRLRYWKPTIDSGIAVVVWRQDWPWPSG